MLTDELEIMCFILGMSDIIKQLVRTTDNLFELVHVLLDNLRSFIIKLVYRLSRLEKHIRVLRCPFDGREVGGVGATAMIRRPHKMQVPPVG